MKRVLALFLAAVSFLLPAGASATGQTAERLIVGCDTMSLYALPLMKADSTVLARLEKRLKEIDAIAPAVYSPMPGKARRAA